MREPKGRPLQYVLRGVLPRVSLVRSDVAIGSEPFPPEWQGSQVLQDQHGTPPLTVLTAPLVLPGSLFGIGSHIRSAERVGYLDQEMRESNE